MNCPNCRAGMEALVLESHIGVPLTIDACWPCHLLWFDHLESAALSARSIIELFKKIHATQAGKSGTTVTTVTPDSGAYPEQGGGATTTRNTIGNNLKCPTCTTTLKLTSDIQRNGRFSYHRCQQSHGRATSFTQFLREKNFIRSLNPVEIKSLAVNIKQIRCSSCGGSIHLENDVSCSHCGSAISVLDHNAVEKALEALRAKQNSPTPQSQQPYDDVRLVAALEKMRELPEYRPSTLRPSTSIPGSADCNY